MNRRTLLKGITASALAAGMAPSLVAGRPRSVIVVGAGILGAAIAYELAKRGVQVTILERTAPAAGTSKDSYAYLNASTKSASRPYFDLNWQGISGWRVWQQEPGEALPIKWGGAVYWTDKAADGAKLAAAREQVRRWGYAAESVDAPAIARLLPTVHGPASLSDGSFFAQEGAVDPVAAVAALLARAKRLGARLIYPAEVQELIVENNAVRGVRTRDGTLLADTVVLASGLGARALAEAKGVKLPLEPSTGILLHTNPARPLLDRLVFAPGASFRQQVDGRILASIGHEGASGNASDADAIGRTIHALATGYLPGLKGVGIDRLSVGQRVLPADGFPIVGPTATLPGLYVTVTHSGMTLAPIIGRLAATEIVDGGGVALLDPFRPGRFA
jgi:glycine/D-amino acid oxidase-like deaminating enzyme